jgi:hypothetical protein
VIPSDDPNSATREKTTQTESIPCFDQNPISPLLKNSQNEKSANQDKIEDSNRLSCQELLALSGAIGAVLPTTSAMSFTGMSRVQRPLALIKRNIF